MKEAAQSFIADTMLVGLEREALFARLEQALLTVGFPYFAFGSLWGNDPSVDRAQPPAIRLRYPNDWITRYFAAGYAAVDPVLLAAPHTQTSASWSELYAYHPRLFDEASEYGIRSGVAVPLRAFNGGYVINFASDSNIKISKHDRACLESIAYNFFLSFTRTADNDKTINKLSSNTIATLKLYINGLSTSEIADELGITKQGVYWCIESAKKSLGCRNQAQLFLRAIQLGIVAI